MPHSTESNPRDRFRMWRNLWLFWVLLILIVCSYPCGGFHAHAHWDKVGWIPFQNHSFHLLFDDMRNIVLYVPFGFFYVQSWSPSRTSVILKVALLSALLSIGCEFFQIYCHLRSPSMTDVSTNVLGGVIGAVIALRVHVSERIMIFR